MQYPMSGGQIPGGLVPIINYASSVVDQSFYLITQSNIDITTQASENILVQEA